MEEYLPANFTFDTSATGCSGTPALRFVRTDDFLARVVSV